MSLWDKFDSQEVFGAPQSVNKQRTPPASQVTNNALNHAEKKFLTQIEPELASMAQTVFTDPGADISPNDSALWLRLFVEARKFSFELHAKLFYIRGGGAVLVPSQKYGYMIKPIIDPKGKKGFVSYEIYNQEKQCLEVYKNEIILLLRKLSKKSD